MQPKPVPSPENAEGSFFKPAAVRRKDRKMNIEVVEDKIIYGGLVLATFSIFDKASKVRFWEKRLSRWNTLLLASERLGRPLPNEFSPSFTKAGVKVWSAEWRCVIDGVPCSFDIVSGTQMWYTYTSRIGEQFSGNGSSDNMRDAYETHTVTQKKEYVWPEIRSMYSGKYREYNVDKIYEMLSASTIREL